jgi:hypothetical protein
MRTQICRSTLLSLVQAVQDHTASDEEAVAIIAHMLSTRRVVLIGTFAAERIAEADEPEFGLERICAA